jgi:ADP-dependent NAD(P)H-hydrate dehydratase / NAD(P)H-hydrate epimerase
MERAAEQVVAVMKNNLDKADRILAVCGPGNNGGDGIAAGRILFLQGYHVAILFIGEEERASEATRIQLERARNLGISFENSNKLPEYNILIDSIFGVGLSREVTGIYESIIYEINQNDNTVYSVDVPSGISSDDGKVLGIAVRADYTITFGHQKLGLILYPGADYAGNTTVADIGFPKEATNFVKPVYTYYDEEDLNRLPVRNNYSNKGTFGKVLVIAGCKGMSGAAYFSAKAAYRTGAGLVKVLTSKENRSIIQSSLPEALFSAYDEQDSIEQAENIMKDINWATVIVLGPGLGLSKMAKRLVDTVLSNTKVPVIVDADAITILAEKLREIGKSDIYSLPDSTDPAAEQTKAEAIKYERLQTLTTILPDQAILTPHLMELSRLINIPITDITNNLVDTATYCSYNSKLIYAIKDARTIVAMENRKYINVTGNNGMATGGSGDVLTGIIAGLIAQGLGTYEAACLAVFIHGLAGDFAAEEKGTYSMMASDILNSIEKVTRRKG